MATSSEKVDVHINVRLGRSGGLRVSQTILKKEENGKKTKAFCQNKGPNPNTGERRVFLAQLPGEVWVFTCSGQPMMSRGRTNGPWPNIQQNVEAKRRWIVLVIDGTGIGHPTRDMLRRAIYFDCPVDRALPNNYNDNDTVEKMEALQEIGRTTMTNREILKEVEQLQTYWQVSDSIIWNSQHFSLCLGTIILTDSSFGLHRPTLEDIGRILRHVTGNAENNFLVAKHIGCMAGMAISGVLTFGVGAFGFWAGAGASIGKASYVLTEVGSQVKRLQIRHNRLSGLF